MQEEGGLGQGVSGNSTKKKLQHLLGKNGPHRILVSAPGKTASRLSGSQHRVSRLTVLQNRVSRLTVEKIVFQA